MPTRELELLPQEAVWDHVDRLLEDWENVAHLRENNTVLAWQVCLFHTTAIPDELTVLG